MVTNLAYERLNNLDTWQRMPSITLSEMSGVKLMNRIDTKYVLSYDEALRLINATADNDYYVQIIDGVRACRYETLYYDTSEREMFIVHHNRKLCRQTDVCCFRRDYLLVRLSNRYFLRPPQ